jgi:N-acetylated-alpha-linked acidic dipeptidase
VAYINTDANGRGYLYASGSHTLEKFVNEIAREIEDPEKKIPVWKRSQLKLIADATTPEERQEARQRPDLRIEAAGSGSDYTVFLDHLGIASLNLGYGDEDGGGIYHSIYDDFYWYTHFSDTDFSYARALSQTVGTAVLRLAGADLLPYDFSDFADTTRKYTDELKKLLKDKQDGVTERNRQIDEGVFSATADPKQTFVAPPREEAPPHLNFAPLENAVERVQRSSEKYQDVLKKVTQDGMLISGLASLEEVNRRLLMNERKLTSADGLPGRPWFQHMIYAPGFYTGYAVKTLPGAREAIEQKKWKEADEQIARVAKTLEDEAAWIEGTAVELEKAKIARPISDH